MFETTRTAHPRRGTAEIVTELAQIAFEYTLDRRWLELGRIVSRFLRVWKAKKHWLAVFLSEKATVFQRSCLPGQMGLCLTSTGNSSECLREHTIVEVST